MVAVQTVGEPSQYWLAGIGGNAFNDELMASDAKRNRRTILHDSLGLANDRRRRRLE
jgi:hypothetical protein